MESLERFLREAEKGISPDLKDLCGLAKNNIIAISGKINIDQRRKIETVNKVIDDFAYYGVCKPEQVKEAVLIFNKVILPFLKEEERSKHVTLEKKGASYISKHDGDKMTTAVENEKTPTETRVTEYVKTPRPRGADELADAFRKLFGARHRELLFQEITKHTMSEKLGIECLTRIVEKSFEICKQEADLQLHKAVECAKQIMKSGKLDFDDTGSSRLGKSSDELIRRYRYIHADLAKGRLQTILLNENHALLYNTYNIDIKENTNLISFTRDCAEITWFMCVEDPAIVIVHESNSFDENTYDIERGKSLNSIVWSALKFECSNGVLSKGIAWCK